MSDTAYLRAFERGEVPASEFGHASHLRLALACLEESPGVDEAAARMAAALRAFAASVGRPEKYHHTMTLFWVRMVARLLDRDLPLAYYSRERLFGDAARAGWLEPDLKEIDDPAPRPPDPPRDAPDRPLPR
ncbi:MAG TPA: hypothetical protein VFM29_04565 [Vicinamibacteria bacterium]|nr:hypothetical protein [Vicinamibacteria bacterium]